MNITSPILTGVARAAELPADSATSLHNLSNDSH
jgi:hypothetical protein